MRVKTIIVERNGVTVRFPVPTTRDCAEEALDLWLLLARRKPRP